MPNPIQTRHRAPIVSRVEERKSREELKPDAVYKGLFDTFFEQTSHEYLSLEERSMVELVDKGVGAKGLLQLDVKASIVK